MLGPNTSISGGGIRLDSVSLMRLQKPVVSDQNASLSLVRLRSDPRCHQSK
jgi:hypothetical protein